MTCEFNQTGEANCKKKQSWLKADVTFQSPTWLGRVGSNMREDCLGQGQGFCYSGLVQCCPLTYTPNCYASWGLPYTAGLQICTRTAGTIFKLQRKLAESTMCITTVLLTGCRSWQLMVETDMGGTGLSSRRGGSRRSPHSGWCQTLRNTTGDSMEGGQMRAVGSFGICVEHMYKYRMTLCFTRNPVSSLIG